MGTYLSTLINLLQFIATTWINNAITVPTNERNYAIAIVMSLHILCGKHIHK